MRSKRTAENCCIHIRPNTALSEPPNRNGLLASMMFCEKLQYVQLPLIRMGVQSRRMGGVRHVPGHNVRG